MNVNKKQVTWRTGKSGNFLLIKNQKFFSKFSALTTTPFEVVIGLMQKMN